MNWTSTEPSGWPDLVIPGWEKTSRTLHLWMQVVGKTRLMLTPMMNHWWQVPLYLTARGLDTSPIPYGRRVFEVEFDLIAHRLELRASDGVSDGFPLADAWTVAGFHARYFEGLRRLGVEVTLSPLAVELPETIYLDRDQTIRRYDPEWATRFFTALVQVDRLLKEFRGKFLGKASPVHFFWGSFDMAVTRFSGMRAPLHPGGAPHVSDQVMQEAYSHEVSSAGFWPGGMASSEAVFYSYAYPEPDGFSSAPVLPRAARYDPTLKEFILPYEAVRTASAPDTEVRLFLETTYLAAAELGHWRRSELERPAPEPPQPWEEPHDVRV
jgi:uncharacterized protein DUF5996